MACPRSRYQTHPVRGVLCVKGVHEEKWWRWRAQYDNEKRLPSSSMGRIQLLTVGEQAGLGCDDQEVCCGAHAQEERIEEQHDLG